MPTLSDVADRLGELLAILDEADAPLARLITKEALLRDGVDDIRHLHRTASRAAKLSRNHKHIMFAGRFSSGKSSLINALVGKRIRDHAVDQVDTAITMIGSNENEEHFIQEGQGIQTDRVDLPFFHRAFIFDTPGTGDYFQDEKIAARYFIAADHVVYCISFAQWVGEDNFKIIRLLTSTFPSIPRTFVFTSIDTLRAPDPDGPVELSNLNIPERDRLLKKANRQLREAGIVISLLDEDVRYTSAREGKPTFGVDELRDDLLNFSTEELERMRDGRSRDLSRFADKLRAAFVKRLNLIIHHYNGLRDTTNENIVTFNELVDLQVTGLLEAAPQWRAMLSEYVAGFEKDASRRDADLMRLNNAPMARLGTPDPSSTAIRATAKSIAEGLVAEARAQYDKALTDSRISVDAALRQSKGEKPLLGCELEFDAGAIVRARAFLLSSAVERQLETETRTRLLEMEKAVEALREIAKAWDSQSIRRRLLAIDEECHEGFTGKLREAFARTGGNVMAFRLAALANQNWLHIEGAELGSGLHTLLVANAQPLIDAAHEGAMSTWFSDRQILRDNVETATVDLRDAVERVQSTGVALTEKLRAIAPNRALLDPGATAELFKSAVEPAVDEAASHWKGAVEKIEQERPQVRRAGIDERLQRRLRQLDWIQNHAPTVTAVFGCFALAFAIWWAATGFGWLPNDGLWQLLLFIGSGFAALLPQLVKAFTELAPRSPKQQAAALAALSAKIMKIEATQLRYEGMEESVLSGVIAAIQASWADQELIFEMEANAFEQALHEYSEKLARYLAAWTALRDSMKAWYAAEAPSAYEPIRVQADALRINSIQPVMTEIDRLLKEAVEYRDRINAIELETAR
jgi:hypothetical protein